MRIASTCSSINKIVVTAPCIRSELAEGRNLDQRMRSAYSEVVRGEYHNR
jgi:hypothetical protein